MKKLVHVKSLITLALCLMMCFTFFAPASTVQAKKRVVDNVFMYPTDPYSYPTCTGWVPCKKTFTSSKKASKTYVRETAWKVIDTAYLYKAATSRGKVFYTKYIATRNAIMKAGHIIDVGTTDELVKQIEGKVWNCTVPAEKLPEYELRLRIINQRGEDNNQVSIRYLADKAELDGAVPASPRFGKGGDVICVFSD